MQVVGAALMADVSNSTPLFERSGDQQALSQITDCLEIMRAQIDDLGGLFLHSKGDDVLAYFEDADAAFEMAKRAVRRPTEDALKVHAGISWGSLIRLSADLYGTPVNIASRLSNLAKPHEVLVHASLFEELSPTVRATLREVDALSLKGSKEKLAIFSFVADDLAGRTVNFTAAPTTSEGSLSVHLQHDTVNKEMAEGGELTLGRAAESDIVVAQPFVSRQHATVSVMNGIVVFKDHSTLGSFIRMDQGKEIVARRGSVTLIGSGRISLGAPFSQSEQAIVKYSQSRSLSEQIPTR